MYPNELALFIDGEWCHAGERDTAVVVNPSTEEVIGTLPLASATDLDRALAAASRGFLEWSSVSPWERGRILRQAATIIAQRSDEMAHIMTLEQGKPLIEARGEMDRVVETFEWCSQEATRTYGRLLPQRSAGTRQATAKYPVGPVAAFSPWNFPAVLAARKIAAALAAGCSVVVKPAEETPAVCMEIVRACSDADVPAGVLNLVFGVPAQISKHLLTSPIIRKISFTGSVAVGKQLSRLAADGLKKVTMELGGHAPVIVYDDADVDKAARMTAGFKYRNAGQVCLAPSRIFVQEKLYDSFLDRFISVVQDIKVGDGLDPDNQMGPLANERRLKAMEELVDDCRSRGARIVTGGKRIGSRGYFFEPTVVTEIPDDSDIMTVEPFGPIVPIVPFSDDDEAIARANNLPYGLAAYAFTGSVGRATVTADRLEAGWIGINNFCPFLADAPGGGYKESGVGYEGGPEGLDAYLQTKFISQVPL